MTMGVILSISLLGGFIIGWMVGKWSGLLMPNALVTSVLLVAGSVGGPLLTYTLFGPGTLSFAGAVAIAGSAAGLVFWPMGQPQGKRQWL